MSIDSITHLCYNTITARAKPLVSNQVGGERMDKDMSMTAKEAARMADWMEAHGHTAEEVIECMKYITGTEEPSK